MNYPVLELFYAVKVHIADWTKRHQKNPIFLGNSVCLNLKKERKIVEIIGTKKNGEKQTQKKYIEIRLSTNAMLHGELK